jgi:hypothetical protein
VGWIHVCQNRKVVSVSFIKGMEFLIPPCDYYLLRSIVLHGINLGFAPGEHRLVQYHNMEGSKNIFTYLSVGIRSL